MLQKAIISKKMKEEVVSLSTDYDMSELTVRLNTLRNIISEQCGIQEVILDNLVNSWNGMRVTVGLIDEAQASVVMAKLNGYYLGGRPLKVEVLQKKPSPPQQFSPGSLYNPAIPTPMPFQNNNMMYPPVPPVNQVSNSFSNLPFYVASVETSYGNSSFQSGPPVKYPVYGNLNTSNDWNTNIPTGLGNSKNANQRSQYSGGPQRPEQNAKNRGVMHDDNSDFGNTSFGNRSLNDYNDPDKYGGPRHHSKREQGRCESENQRRSQFRSRSPPRDRFDNHNRYDDRERDRSDSRERDRSDNRGHDRFDNRDRDRSDNRDRDRFDNRDRDRFDNDNRNDGRGRNRYDNRSHDHSRGRGGSGSNNSPFGKTNSSGTNKDTSDYGFVPREEFLQTRDKSGPGRRFKRVVPNANQSNQSPRKELKTIVFVTSRTIIDEMLSNIGLEALPQGAFKKLKALIGSRIYRIIEHMDNPCVNKIHELYRRQYAVTEDKIVLDAALNAPIESAVQCSNDNGGAQKTFKQIPPTKAGPRNAFAQRSATNAGPRNAFAQRSATNTGPRNAFAQRSATNTGPRNAFAPRSATNTGPRNAFAPRSATNTGPRNAFAPRSATNTGPRNKFAPRSATNTGPRNKFAQKSATSTGPQNKFAQRSATSTGPRNKFALRSATSTGPRNAFAQKAATVTVPAPMRQVAPNERLPKYPNSDKKAFKQLKKMQQDEAREDYVHEIDPKYLPALETEMEALREVFVNACTPSEDENIEKVRQEIVSAGVEKFLRVIKLQVSKRLAGSFVSSVRIQYHYASPPRDALDSFLKEFGVISLKKNDQKKLFVATCDNSDGYDKLIAMGDAVVGGVQLHFKPFQIMGKPEKYRKVNKNYGNEGFTQDSLVDLTMDVKSEGEDNKDINIDEESDNKDININEESDNKEIDINEESLNNDINKEESDNKDNIKEESDNKDNIKEESKKDKNEALAKIDDDDLEDF